MSRDRTGDEADDHECRDGWLSAPDADVAVACPCRWQRTAAANVNNDFAVRTPSPRAAAAIRAEENR
ncbi:hypothetical protein [Nocardia sp. MW-W600-9]